MSLSPMIVIALALRLVLLADHLRLGLLLELGLQRRDHVALGAITSATVATLRPSTRISLPLTTTTSVSFGTFSAVDSGSLHRLRARQDLDRGRVRQQEEDQDA